MKKSLLARAVAGVFVVAGAAQAQEDAVVITATPLGSGLFELVPPASVLSGRELLLQRRSSLGETLEREPGVSSTYFGPHVSRPVIRGLDADRIRILQNGVGTLDASSLSFDHAVPYDPLVAERLEVVRGPAAVLYGGNAVGGVVNVIDNRIPETPLTGSSGRVEPRYGGADRERSIGGLIEAGNGRIALHADGFTRKARELKIPDFARSDRLRATDAPGVVQPRGSLPNSNAQADGGTLGGSFTWASGYVGLSYGGYSSNYGSIPEPTVRIDMESERWDFAGEARELGAFITGVKFKLGHTDYEHREIDAGTVSTSFKNKGHDGRLELRHGKLGPLQGALGVSFSDFDFSALGAEAFVPSTSTDSKGLFLYEELPAGALKLSLGARNERTQVESQGGGVFGSPASRSFDAQSGAFGLLYSMAGGFALASNLSVTQRAPTFYELFASGPHAATGAFEVGDPTLQKEKSRSIDVGLRWRQAAHSASVSLFRTRFDNFIGLFGSGNLRLEDGSAAADADGDGLDDATAEAVLPEFTYRAVPALFRGLEAQSKLRVYERTGGLDLLLQADYVKATNRETGGPLPRIPPLRLNAAREYALNRWSGRLELRHARKQNRVDVNELPTDSYTLVNAALAYSFDTRPVAMQAFMRLNNLFDEEARNHVSFLKDIAPLGGRSVLVGVRGSF